MSGSCSAAADVSRTKIRQFRTSFAQRRAASYMSGTMKLFRFPYSPFAHKVQVVLDLAGMRYSVVDVPYCDRAELVAATGGYVGVPVLVDDDGSAVCDSRLIVERILARA